MKYRLLVALLALCAFVSPAGAAGKNSIQRVMTATEVAVSADVDVVITNAQHDTAYLVVQTENETATAVMTVRIETAGHAGAAKVLCTTAADTITTNTTTIWLLGSLVPLGNNVTYACDMPLPMLFNIEFVVTGAGADFDVTADLLWLTD